jgi:glucose-1-phosphate adenylyltransferase
MDYRVFVEYHVETGADITMAVQPVSADMAPALGILKRSEDGQIKSFTEKPELTALAGLESISGSDKPYLASMGIYVFRTDLLLEVLKSEGDDFGKDIIPIAVADYRVMGHVYEGYWADIGTIRRFYEVNLEMTLPDRPFDFYIPGRPIYSRARFLPATEVYGARIENALIADGCRVADSQITHAVIGLRCQIGPKTKIRSTILMGADYYETEADRAENKRLDRPDIGIGDGTVIGGAIIDKNARIGRNVHIRHLPDRPDSETDNWVSRDGLVVIPKNAAIADEMVI